MADTHAWLWWVTDDSRLSPVAKSSLDDEDDVFIPSMVCWEVALLDAGRRITLEAPVLHFLNAALAWRGVETLW